MYMYVCISIHRTQILFFNFSFQHFCVLFECHLRIQFALELQIEQIKLFPFFLVDDKQEIQQSSDSTNYRKFIFQVDSHLLWCVSLITRNMIERKTKTLVEIRVLHQHVKVTVILSLFRKLNQFPIRTGVPFSFLSGTIRIFHQFVLVFTLIISHPIFLPNVGIKSCSLPIFEVDSKYQTEKRIKMGRINFSFEIHKTQSCYYIVKPKQRVIVSHCDCVLESFRKL